MAKLLMITGRGSAVDIASGKKGAFYNTLEELHKYWERIDIIAPKVQTPIFNFQFSKNTKILFGNVYVHVSPWPLIFHPFWFLKKGLEIYKEQKFDLMTIHEFPPFYNGIAARLIWNKIRVPYILEIFHIPGYPKAANLKERIYRWLFYFFIGYDSRKAKAVRVMNSQVAEKLADLGIPRSKIKLIPAIYVDLEVFKPMNLEKKYDLIFIGRLVKNKGVELFLETVKRLSCKALIVGDGPLKESIKLKIENWKLKIDMYGWAKDSREIAELMNRSRLLVMPSYSEGGPRVVLEAMACGVPVLATGVGIVPDLEKMGALEIIGWNAGDISKKAKDLLADDVRYGELSKLGIQMAKRFEKVAAIENYASKLKEVLN